MFLRPVADCFDFDYNLSTTQTTLADVTGVESAAQCQCHCQETDGCFYFVWHPPEMGPYGYICTLKSTNEGRKAEAPMVSGPKYC